MRLFRTTVILFVFVLLAEAGSYGAGHVTNQARKSLPLDGVPDVVLKSRDNSEYLADCVIVKLMEDANLSPSSGSFGIASIDVVLSTASVSSVKEMFPQGMAGRAAGNADLSRFYVVKYTSPVDPFSLAEQLSSLPEVQYAEPWFIYPVAGSPLYTPNDPMLSSQYGLTRIQVQQAWDITRGDTAVVIGIVDSGVELNHPDLAANIWHNPGEMGTDGNSNDRRTNGIDDDNNGYIDDWRGWDFGGADYNNPVPDNNPNPTGSNNNHGTHVAGIVSAATDNGIGVAGTGFRCRLLAVKTAADNDTRGTGGTGYIIAGYQGIAYAALMGAAAMNCSWGGSGGSQFEQDVINYATQQGTLVVAAAGNDASSGSHYPSGYQNVISVAATNSSDVRASFSNYGMTVDVSAPGASVYSTVYPSTYTAWDGTSMSSPFAAGTAGLIKSVRPSLNSVQLGEQLRVTCDNINSINPPYVDLLGKGRINAYRAVTVNSPALRAGNFYFSDGNNGIPEPNDTLSLYFTFTNYLWPTTNAAVTLSTTSSYLTILNNSFTVGALGTLDTIRNTSAPYRVRANSNVPPGHLATMKLTITDGTYSDYQWFTVLNNPTFQTHNANNIEVTLTNNGRVAYNDFPNNTQGRGFRYPVGGADVLFEGGIVAGYSSTKLVNNIRNANNVQDNDMKASTIYQLQSPGVVSNQDGYTWYSDSLAPTANRIGLRFDQYTYAFTALDHDDYVIVRYDVRNISTATISNLYVGQFFDWDIASYSANRTAYDATRSLAYAWDNSSTTAPYIGMRALDSAASCRGLVNTTSLDLSRAGKWSWISGGTSQANAGPADIHSVISSGPYTLAPGTTRMFGFAMMGGANLAELLANADAARTKWEVIKSLVPVEDQTSVPLAFGLEQNYPNPFNPTTNVQFLISDFQLVSLKIFDLLGREVATLVNDYKTPGAYAVEWDAKGMASGVYLYRLTAGTSVETKKLVLLR